MNGRLHGRFSSVIVRHCHGYDERPLVCIVGGHLAAAVHRLTTCSEAPQEVVRVGFAGVRDRGIEDSEFAF